MSNNNSDDKNSNDDLPEIDYSKHKPKIIDELLKIEAETIQKEAKISWDGRQYIVRIPKEISQVMDITTENKIRFIVTKPPPHENAEKKMDMILI